MAHHRCPGKWCPSCRRRHCPDFIEAKQALARGQVPTPTSVYCVAKHFSGTNATTTTCSDVASASNPRATLIKSSQTEVTSTNQTQGRAVAEIASLNTSWIGKMPHLRKDSLSGNSPTFYSTSARRCGRSQKETCVTQ